MEFIRCKIGSERDPRLLSYPLRATFFLTTGLRSKPTPATSTVRTRNCLADTYSVYCSDQSNLFSSAFSSGGYIRRSYTAENTELPSSSVNFTCATPLTPCSAMYTP